MGFLIWVFVILAMLAAALFIRVDHMDKPFSKIVAKFVASALFVLIGILCCNAATIGPGRGYYAPLMMLGLIFGLVGDVALAYQNVQPRKKDASFKVGLSAFFIGHVFYIIVLICLSGVNLAHVLVSIAIFIALFAIQHITRLDFGKMKPYALVYAGILAVLGGFAFGAVVHAASLLSWMLFIASILFIVSDCVLAYIYFGGKRGKLSIICLGTYYAAQILFALSIWLR